MRGRRYINRIAIWRKVELADGHGGHTNQESNLVDSSWCKVKTLDLNRRTDLGLSEYNYAIQVDLRKRDDLDYNQEDIYFVYKNNEFVFKSIAEKDLDGYDVRIIAARR